MNAQLLAELMKQLEEALLYDEHQHPCIGYIGDEPCVCGYQDWWDRSNAVIVRAKAALAERTKASTVSGENLDEAGSMCAREEQQ